MGRNESGKPRIEGIDVELTPCFAGGEERRFDRCKAMYEDFRIVTESVRRSAAGFSARGIRDARGQRADFISAARHRFRSSSVSSHIQQGVDFARFQTWDFGPADTLPTGDPRLDNNPFFKDYLEGAVGKALEDRRYVRSASGTPDLLVHYHANISKTFDVNGIDSRYGNCYDNCEPRVIEYEQGTIVLDVVDTQTNRLVWRGWAQDSIDGVIDNQNSLRKEVTTAVARMMERFPRHL